MDVILKKATIEDANFIYEMQNKAFIPLLQQYEDYDTSPANQPIERVIFGLNRNDTTHYLIMYNGIAVGTIRIRMPEGSNNVIKVDRIFVNPDYQNRGISQEVFKLIEDLYPNKCWKLDTILEEKGNVYLYEKIGYTRTGKYEQVNEKMTLVFYEKNLVK